MTVGQDSLFGDDRIDQLVRRLQSLTWIQAGQQRRWPADDAKDRALVVAMLAEHRGGDLARRLDAWAVWMSAQNKMKEVNCRGRIKNWVCYAERYGTRRPDPGGRGAGKTRPGGGGTVAGGAPSPAGAWGGGSGYRDW